MMKDTKTEKDKLHRYLDDLYTRDDASQLLQSIKDSENQDILDELAAEVWEESGNLQPGNDLEREKYKREARQLLKRIEHKKRTWFRRASVVAVSTAAVIAIIIGSVNFFRYMNEQQVTLAEITTSFGEKRQVTLPDGTLLVLTLVRKCVIRIVLLEISVKWNLKERDISVLPVMKRCHLL